MRSANSDPASGDHIPGRPGRPPVQRRIRIDAERRDVVDHRKLARALLRLAQAEYDLQQAATTAFPASPGSSEAPVRPHRPDSAHLGREMDQPDEPAQTAADDGSKGAPA